MNNQRAYLLPEVLEKLQMKRSTFFSLQAAGQLVMVEELKPRLGRRIRYKAEPIDRYVAGQWGIETRKYFVGVRGAAAR